MLLENLGSPSRERSVFEIHRQARSNSPSLFLYVPARQLQHSNVGHLYFSDVGDCTPAAVGVS